ncbi:hypothetical protein SOP85_09730 [Pseudomonas sp. YuFO20]|uniref:hypothetical protein n=1 Tax=Pseudomonas sp. YuFO20 TaxID=3095362 RepID=UPI002B250BA8|nr:hypothetical protein [Pseudomonas sp. YuFO20]MEB2515716.1 hypothetical protein [Pseudomonas sp. YuFO20]
MEQLIEYCKQRFLDEFEYKFSLSNILCWALYLCSIYVYYDMKETSLFKGLSGVPISSLFDIKNGVLPDMSIIIIISSLIFVYVITTGVRALTEFMFYLFCLSHSLDTHLVKLVEKFRTINKGDETALKYIEKESSSKLSENSKILRRRQNFAEILITVFVCSWLSFRFDIGNIAIAFASALLFITSTWSSFKFFLSHVLPYYVAAKFLTNETPILGEGFSEATK